MCNISKQQKKLNIENIKDLTQPFRSLKLFHIMCLCLDFYVYNTSSLPYVTKLPGVALHDVIYRLCLTAAVFRDVTKNMVPCFALRDVT